MSRTVGLVADNAAAMVQLGALVDELGHTVAYTLNADQALGSSPLHPSLWIVVSEQAADIFEVLSEWSEAPIFLADDLPAEEDVVFYEQWRMSLGEKIKKTLEKLEPEVPVAPKKPIIDPHAFKDVWVLAASLGGPEAVRVFLANIHPDLPVVFIYAQHIEESFGEMLPRVISKHSRFAVDSCSEGESLKRGRVVVYPSHNIAKVDERGRFHVFPEKQWEKPYTPNIDQVIRNVGENYKDRMGVIIFSGTCDDGAASSIELKAQGVPIWAQKPDDCICPAMPEAVILKKAVNYIGTSIELAKHINNRYGLVEMKEAFDAPEEVVVNTSEDDTIKEKAIEVDMDDELELDLDIDFDLEE